MKIFTSTEYSRHREFKLIVKKVETYRSELGFPEENSEYLNVLGEPLQKKVKTFRSISEMNVASWLRNLNIECGNEDAARGNEDAARGNEDAARGNEDAARGNEDAALGNEDAGCGNEDAARGIKDAGRGNQDAARGNEDVASGNITLPWLFTYRSLHHVLDEMEETAIKILQFTAEKYARDNDIAM